MLSIGILSIVLLLWVSRINQDQNSNFIFSDVVMDIRVRTATFHLWLEEILVGETAHDPMEVWADIEQAISLTNALLHGGDSDHGLKIEPLQDQSLRPRVEILKKTLEEFRATALERWINPDISGIGSAMDERFDLMFRNIMNETQLLENTAEKNQVKSKQRTERLFAGIIFIWGVIISLATVLIRNRELKRREAEEALQRANDELEQRVRERTVELWEANRTLIDEISERRRAEDSIRLYEEVVRHMPIGLYVVSMGDSDDHTFHIVTANPVAKEAVELKPEMILAKMMDESLLGRLQNEAPYIHEEIIHTGPPASGATSDNRKEGPCESYFHTIAFPLPNRCIGIVFKNITERIIAENSLLISENRFKTLSLEFHTLLNAIPDSIMLLSPERKILWANRGASRRANAAAELTARHCFEGWPESTVECIECPVMKSFQSGRVEMANVSCSDGTNWNVRAFPIKNEAGAVVNVIELAADITEKMAMEAETMRAAHLASIGELASGVAHEINNPISGIINCAEILSEESGGDARKKDIADRIIKEGCRIAGIVRGLLSFARDSEKEKAAVHIEEILADSFALTESQLRKNAIRVAQNIPAGLSPIYANPQQIQQVLLNIINNARYALNEKYPIGDDDKILEIACAGIHREGKEYLEITFRDHGIGISADILDKIMIPFFSTKPFRKGTGLGLSISDGIISDHGGRLMISSIEGEFTKVSILLPVMENANGEDSHH